MQPREGAVAFANNSFAEEVLASLADLRDPALEIVGPTTSTAYDQPEGGIRKLVDDLHIEFVINGRFIHSDGSDRILLEIIRGADGAHVWVRSFGVDASGEEIAGAVQDGLVEHIRKKGD
jgi:TolB-like protein